MTKPILCLDFDGVIHSYTSPWISADIIPDPPVEGAFRFIISSSKHFRIAIFSSRSHQWGGKKAMSGYIAKGIRDLLGSDVTLADDILSEIYYPAVKPPAFLTIDDRAWTFTGKWPEVAEMLKFKPWNKV